MAEPGPAPAGVFISYRQVVDMNAPHRLQAVCRTDGAQQHLGFSLDNRLVVSVTDAVKPLTGGTVGVGAFVGSGANSIVARFDDFAVTAG